MHINEVGASVRRHWPVALAILALIPLVMVGYLVNRDVVRPPDRYTTSADVLIPARDPETHADPEGVPPVLLQGQADLAASSTTRDVALQAAGIDPESDHGISFDARLVSDDTIMTLAVAAPDPQLAADVLDLYVEAYEEGRRQSVYESAIDLQDIELRVIGVLTRRIQAVEQKLVDLGVVLPLVVPDGAPIELPLGTPNEAILLAYERNALLNEMQRRQVSFSLQATRAEIPAAYTTVVQTRSASRVTPPPPSPLVPLLQILGVGLLLAVAIPVLLDRLDSTITEARAAPPALRSRLLATLPYLPRRMQTAYAPNGSTWDAAFRTLAATSISTDELPKALMVTCPVGSTQDSVAANLAGALARLGMDVTLIGTIPRQDWYLHHVAESEDDLEDDVYVDVDAVVDEEEDPEPLPETASGPVWPTTPVGAPPTSPEATQASVATVTAPPGSQAPVGPGVAANGSLSHVPTFPELLRAAHAGRLPVDLRAELATSDIANLTVVPPGGPGDDLVLDGLPPLLDALDRSGVGLVVLAAPGLLEDPNATIMAWSTRHVLWTLELGRVKTQDAELAAERVELAGVVPFGIAVVNRMTVRP